MGSDTKRLRVFYATGGPEDIVEAYRQERLREGGKQPLVSDVSVSYSNQLLEACAAAGAAAWAISPNPRVDRIEDRAFVLEHRPMPAWRHRGGLAWHLGTTGYQLRLMWRAVRFRADVAVLGMAGHFWLYAPLRLFGVRIVPLLHCTFWPAGFRQTGRLARLVQRMNGWFWRRHVFASIVVSKECGRQINEIAGGEVPGPILVALPLFRREVFSQIPAPPAARRPFTVMFAGRVERFKGVFDVLEIAAALERQEPGGYVFEVCGDGGALEELRKAVAERGQRNVHLLGRLDREQMAQAYGRSHVVITPTTSSFEEGFCQVSAESILAGRPLVASRVCPAIDHLGDTLLDVPAGDIEGYAEAIRRLAHDPSLYEAKRAACSQVAPPYYDWNEGLGGMVLRVISQANLAAGRGSPPRGETTSSPA